MSKLIKIINYTKEGKVIKRNKFNYESDSLKTEILIDRNIILFVNSESDYEVFVFLNGKCVKKEDFVKNIQSLNIDIPFIKINSFKIVIENEKEKDEIIILEENKKSKIHYSENIKNITENVFQYLEYVWDENSTWDNIIKDMVIFEEMDVVEFIVEKGRIDDVDYLKEIFPINNKFIFTLR